MRYEAGRLRIYLLFLAFCRHFGGRATSKKLNQAMWAARVLEEVDGSVVVE